MLREDGTAAILERAKHLQEVWTLLREEPRVETGRFALKVNYSWFCGLPLYTSLLCSLLAGVDYSENVLLPRHSKV